MNITISEEEYEAALATFDSLSQNHKNELIDEAGELLTYNLSREKIYNNISKNVLNILNAIDSEFDVATKFDKYDWSVFAIAIMLQCLRQYLGPNLTEKIDRVDHKQADKDVKGNKKKNKREIITHRFYHPTLLEIQTKTVPFDTNYGSHRFGEGQGGDHRCYTLGHDPILGYLFGTMNIMTATVTLSNFQSYHVSDKELSYQRQGNTVTSVRDYWSHRADLSKIIYYSKSRLCDEGLEGKKAFVTAFIREFVHLRSDIGSKNSLPLPCLTVQDAGELANELCNSEINLINLQAIGFQATLSIIINSLIYLIHRLTRSSNCDLRAHITKTKFILLWSNFIATETNLLYCGLTGNHKKMDVGGLMVTLWRIVKDFDSVEKLRTNYRREKFEEFLNNPNNIIFI